MTTRQESRRVHQVVFACVRNGGRSVASRLLTEHYAGGGRVRALSAGTRRGEHIHPEVAEALQKLGLDTSREHPKLLTRHTVAASDIDTLGCGEECPYVPGVTYLDWPVDDPRGQDEATVRRIIADLDTRVRDLLIDIVPGIELSPSVLDQE